MADGTDTKQKRKSLRFDIILIAALLIISLCAVLLTVHLREDGSYAVVKIDGREVARYSLAKDGEYTLGGGTNKLCIKDGEVYMTYADCPDRTCVNTGRVRYVNQSIICLPNKVSVIIVGSGDGTIVS